MNTTTQPQQQRSTPNSLRGGGLAQKLILLSTPSVQNIFTIPRLSSVKITTITGDLSVKNVMFEFNNSHQSALSIRRVATTSTSAGVRITSNKFNNYNTTPISLHLQNTDKALVGHNDFIASPPSPNALPVPQQSNPAILLDTVTNAQIKDNDFTDRSIGIGGTKDLSGTIYSCNDFDDCLIGLKFENGTVSNQDASGLAVDNTWIDFCLPLGPGCNAWTQARIYADNLTGVFNYNFSGSNGTNKDPQHGTGVLPTSSSVNDISNQSTNSNCSILTKKEGESEVSIKQFYKFTIYPNPTKEYIVVEPVGDYAPERVTIKDLQGKILIQSENELIIHFNNRLSSGVYILEIESLSGIYREKMTVSK